MNKTNKSTNDKKSQSPFFNFKNAFLYKGDVLDIDAFSKEFCDLIVTSPPYNVGIEYNSNDDVLSYENYLDFSAKWIKNCFYWAKDSGRFILNIPLDKNKGGQKSVGADLTTIAQKIGWKYHSTVIWNEGNISRRTAWGSFMSASAPYVIAPVELILILYKKEWKKTTGSKTSDISKKEFMDWTSGVWTFNGESKKRIGHPAPFPKELPYRAIKLFSYVKDIVFDPFSGSGTTPLTAALNNRIGVGLDIDLGYCNLAKKRILTELNWRQTMSEISQNELIKEFFIKNPNRDVKHSEVVDWLTSEYKKRTGKIFRDPDRGIRKLHQNGFLVKVNKGVYRYSPKTAKHRDLKDFTQKQKDEILKRDGYKCVQCGRGLKEGVEVTYRPYKSKGFWWKGCHRKWTDFVFSL